MGALGGNLIGVIDTSAVIARAQGIPLRWEADVPSALGISAVTLSELIYGVLVAPDPSVRASRLETVAQLQATTSVLPITESVASKYADLRATARERGRRLSAPDGLIAATAKALDVPLYTKDRDFDGMTGLRVVQV